MESISIERNKYPYLLINSSILFVIAAIVEMTLHESGHFIAGLLAHTKDLAIYHNYVSDNTDGLSLLNNIIIKAGGPVVSLALGILFHILCLKQSGRNLTFLFKLYMSVFGYIGCFGYLLIAPFFTEGDTGYICHVLNFPMWLTVIIAIGGGLILFFLMRSLIRFFVEFGTEEIISVREKRIPFIRSLILFPLLIGIVVTTLLNLPVPTTLSLIAPICSPLTIMWVYGFAIKQSYSAEMMNKELSQVNKISYIWIVFLIFTVVVNRLLVHGFSLNMV